MKSLVFWRKSWYNGSVRYIGNKSKILSRIDALLAQKKLDRDGLVFFDAFCGTAGVAAHYKDRYHIIANDNLYFAFVLAQAKLNAPTGMFADLDDPFALLNEADASHERGFFTQNYAPECSERMYFSHKNAQKIDLIRSTIDDWFAAGKITEQEKYFLIASLIESVSTVANVAGVYGSYLKTWDPRALKDLILTPIDKNPHIHYPAAVYHDDVLNVIQKVSGDILYIDPPYTKNQYSVQYHLLETLALYDNPPLKGKTGARDMTALNSVFSKPGQAHEAFETLIAKANFTHIIVSYSSDGILSKEYIESVLKRHGKADTFSVTTIPYRRYKNTIAQDKADHCEYLFYVEKKAHATYASPLNFIGGKHDLIEPICALLPQNIDTFYDLFGGGFNVGVNVTAQRIVYNDINFKVRELLEQFAQADMAAFINRVFRTIKEYGLKKGDKASYLRLRDKYNATVPNKRDAVDLFLLVMFGYQQQIRFNNKYEYNNPVGQAGFNDRILEKLVSFSRVLKEKNVAFFSRDYASFLPEITAGDFVYLDPPYLITLGSYNDGKRGFNGWNDAEEGRLLAFTDALHAKGVRFMLSNVLSHKGKTNTILQDWIEARGHHVTTVDTRDRNEVIITNEI